MFQNNYFDDYLTEYYLGPPISVGIKPMVTNFKENPYMTASAYYKDRASAEAAAKKYSNKIQQDTPIWKAVAIVKFPVPQMEVEELN